MELQGTPFLHIDLLHIRNFFRRDVITHAMAEYSNVILIVQG